MPLIRDREPDGYIVLRDISWPTYEALLKDLSGHPGVRVAYDRGSLEIMSPSKLHERLKKLLAQVLEILTLELNIRRQSAGSTTWKRSDLARGIEADECYYISTVARVRDKDRADLTVDPPPDLAIEVDLQTPDLDKLSIYAALGVPEVWKYDGHQLRVHVLQPDGRYLEVEQSPSFPFLPLDQLARFLSRARDVDEVELLREFRDWVRRELGQHARS